MGGSQEIRLSEEQVSVLRSDAEQVFRMRAISGTPRIITDWGGRFDRRGASNGKKCVGSQKPRSEVAEQDLGLAFSYMDILGDAAGHLAYTLAHALAFRQGIGSSQVRWIQEQAKQFIREMSSPENIEEWFAIAVFGDAGTHRSSNFDRAVSRVAEKTRGAFDIIPLVLANHKLKVALAMLGGQKIKLRQVVQQPALTLESLKGIDSCTPNKVAALLQLTPRSIRGLAAKKILTRTKNGRIVVDEKLVAEYERRNGPSEY
jgi:hypothetical protein